MFSSIYLQSVDMLTVFGIELNPAFVDCLSMSDELLAAAGLVIISHITIPLTAVESVLKAIIFESQM